MDQDQAMGPPTRRRKGDPAAAAAAAAPAIDPADRLSSLPDEILAEILSFLPAQEAVRTCVLARAWRDSWKLTKRLLITGESVVEAHEFVEALLRRRLRRVESSSLDACEITFHPPVDEWEEVMDGLHDGDMSRVNSWIHHALRCQVKELRVDMGDRMDICAYLQMRWPLASAHLAKLELTGVSMCTTHLNFSACPALEQLEISHCNFRSMRKMTSMSLRHLLITSCESVDDPGRFLICAPRLVSLRIEDSDFRAPVLESMPELVGAYVQTTSFRDFCTCDHPMGCYHVTRAAHTSESDFEEDSDLDDYDEQIETNCLLLQGLAQAKHLVLLMGETYIIRRDLRWCPTFSNLKTLVLDDHLCGPADCSGLACILEHAPVLEKLTVISSGVFGGKYKVELKGCLDPTVKSTMASHHLKIVEIKCEMLNEEVRNVLKFLGTLDICFQTAEQKNEEGPTIT